MAPSHVLVPLDGSPLANEAFSQVLETFDSRITVLNVVTPMDAAMSEGGLLEPGDQRLQDARERTDRLIQGARTEAEARNRTIEAAVETGDPAETILEYVAAHDVGHVVMGGHGGDGIDIGNRLLGTVATTVVAEAPVTVTVVR
jgi:nucleotide-binding universal stress UspA family protein